MAYFVKQEIKISCEDNYVLAVTAYLPDEVKAAVVIGPATGIKRQFYNAFVEYLASNDFGVLTYDNRGIGQSIDGDIATHTASLQCCRQLDKPAAISSLQQLFPNTSYHLVGHSAGGQLIGLAKKATKLSSIFNVASSSGQLRNMKLKDQFKSHFLCICLFRSQIQCLAIQNHNGLAWESHWQNRLQSNGKLGVTAVAM